MRSGPEPGYKDLMNVRRKPTKAPAKLPIELNTKIVANLESPLIRAPISTAIARAANTHARTFGNNAGGSSRALKTSRTREADLANRNWRAGEGNRPGKSAAR